MKRILSLLLVLALTCSLAPAALAAGNAPGDVSEPEPDPDTDWNWDDFNWDDSDWDFYAPGTFSDVPEGAWYEEDLSVCYNESLVSGTDEGTFSPSKAITLGEAVAFAARVHDASEGQYTDFTQGDPWYQVYVDYAVENGIIAQGQYADYTAPATRRQFAAMVVNCVPASVLKVRNPVEDGAIPDLAAGSQYYNEVYSLYRAGILTGADGGGFNPDATITRAEVVAIVARCVDETRLRSFMLTKEDGYIGGYAGGIAFEVPGGFTSLGEFGGILSLYEAEENGETVAEIMIMSAFVGVTEEIFEAGKAEFIQSVEVTLKELVGYELTSSEGELLGFPRVIFEGAMTDEESGKTVKLRADAVFNTGTGRLTVFVFGVDTAAKGDYTAAYLDMLNTAKADKTGLVNTQIRPEFRLAVENMISLITRLVDFAQRYNAATESSRQDMLPTYEALEAEYRGIAERIASLEAEEELSGDEIMFMLIRFVELLATLPENYQEELNKMAESMGIIAPDLGLPDLEDTIPLT